MTTITRRAWSSTHRGAVVGLALGLFAVAAATARENEPSPPVTGESVAELAAFDRVMLDFLSDFGVPGGALAIAREGNLVLSRGYGYANTEDKTPVSPDTLFRLASVSKPITALAIMRLVELGKLALDDHVCDLVAEFDPTDEPAADLRLRRITLRQLLNHSGGWDRDVSFDPMFRSTLAAETVGTTPPADARTVIRYMRQVPLDFDPGARYAYSNFGYCLLGRVIEKVTGQDYESAVRELVQAPASVERMRLGHTRLEEAHADESRYYLIDDAELAKSVFPTDTARVPWPYGGFYMEALDAHGGWVASAVDLTRLGMAIEGFAPRPIVSRESLAAMTAEENRVAVGPQDIEAAESYGLGWTLVPRAEGLERSHGGSLPGTATWWVLRGDGVCYAALFNARPAGERGRGYVERFERGMRDAIGAVRRWPAGRPFTWGGARE